MKSVDFKVRVSPIVDINATAIGCSIQTDITGRLKRVFDHIYREAQK